MDLQDRRHYVTVGDQENDERCPSNHDHNAEIHHLAEECAGARKCQDWWEVTEEVIDNIWPAIVELEYGT